MSLTSFIQHVLDHLRRIAQLFVRAYQQGDIDHADELIELAALLERSPEGAAFVERFCAVAVAI